MTSGANISDCGTYRYSLWRYFKTGEGQATFVMLNPSTADAEENDPTIRRCMDYAARWGFQRLEVVNLFAQRTTDPGKLWQSREAVGPNNDLHIGIALRRSQLVVCAWGVPQSSFVLLRGRYVFEIIVECRRRPHYLKLTKEGFPGHPLYLPKSLKPFHWIPAGAGP